jgi:glycosyltransferase involved in cell wall biosynthesis
MKIACIKFAGLAAGGSEKYLQTLACVLKREHDVDYYYTNNSPRIGTSWKHPDHSEERRQFVESHGIKTIPIHVGAYNEIDKTWIGTNIWDVFNPKEYDVIQTARYGFREFPYTDIRGVRIIDSIHGDLSDDTPSEKVILLCKWQADKWMQSGGDSRKAIIIPTVVYVPQKKPSTIRQRLGIPQDAFVYGFHQRNDDGIFSPVSLAAYSAVEDNSTYFVILGGSNRHRQFVQENGLKNVRFLDFSADVNMIHDFLGGIDVYAHARSDGEVCSAAIIEAMYHGLPVITHAAQNMGHTEQIEGCGKMCWSMDEYVEEMKKLKDEKSYYGDKHSLTLQAYADRYCYTALENSILKLYREIST